MEIGIPVFMFAVFPVKPQVIVMACFLYHPDENGSPCVLPMADARMLFSRIPEPTECLSAITLEQFQSLYGLYFAKEALTDKPCPCFALLRHQEASHYHW